MIAAIPTCSRNAYDIKWSIAHLVMVSSLSCIYNYNYAQETWNSQSCDIKNLFAVNKMLHVKFESFIYVFDFLDANPPSPVANQTKHQELLPPPDEHQELLPPPDEHQELLPPPDEHQELLPPPDEHQQGPRKGKICKPFSMGGGGNKGFCLQKKEKTKTGSPEKYIGNVICIRLPVVRYWDLLRFTFGLWAAGL